MPLGYMLAIGYGVLTVLAILVGYSACHIAGRSDQARPTKRQRINQHPIRILRERPVDEGVTGMSGTIISYLTERLEESDKLCVE
jgi:hypothetical protein